MATSVSELRLPVPPDPAPNGRGGPLPAVSAWRRFRHFVGRLARKHEEPTTPREEILLAQLERLKYEAYERENVIFRLKTELEQKQSEILVKNKQLELMAEVHELDRARVQADQAVYSAVQADMEARKTQRG